MSDQTGPAGALTDDDVWFLRNTHDPDGLCQECQELSPCRVVRLLDAHAAQRAKLQAAEVEATDLRNDWGELSYRLAQVEAKRDRERQRAEAAELKAGELDKEADVFCQAYRWMITDRDRERQRAERLAARVERFRLALSRIYGAWHLRRSVIDTKWQAVAQAMAEKAEAALRGEEGAGDGE